MALLSLHEWYMKTARMMTTMTKKNKKKQSIKGDGC